MFNIGDRVVVDPLGSATAEVLGKTGTIIDIGVYISVTFDFEDHKKRRSFGPRAHSLIHEWEYKSPLYEALK